MKTRSDFISLPECGCRSHLLHRLTAARLYGSLTVGLRLFERVVILVDNVLDESFTSFLGHRVEHVIILRVALAVLVGNGRHAYEHTFLVLKDTDTVDSEGADVCRSKSLELFGIIVIELVDPDRDIRYRLLCSFGLHGIVLLFCLFGGFLLLVLRGSSVAGAFLAVRAML